MDRDIRAAVCSCGGTVEEVEQTPDEQRRFNCRVGCCGIALRCAACGVRFVIAFSSPDPPE